ncbi:MAG: hypothetical protein K0S32_971 [Bacteroidetes bacterium]|jgi:hypothetical protein|nr:hypothetical protein [Bacteroidota bacterium]
MDKKDQTTRNSEDTMEGKLSVSFRNNESLLKFCRETFSGFDPDLYDIVAIRLYYSEETILTLYAVDKEKHKNKSYDEINLQVKKFKVINPALHLQANLIREFNFTISNGDYDLGAMEVTNK